MFRIAKEFAFSAAHVLTGLPPDHPCGRLHGHNYVVRVVLAGEAVDARGFVEDYRALDDLKHWIDETLDHRVLNDVLPGQPSAELLARYLYDRWVTRYPALCEVAVSETPRTWASYHP